MEKRLACCASQSIIAQEGLQQIKEAARCLMKTTLDIDGELLAKAAKLTGIKEETSLVRLGLEALIAREVNRKLAMLGRTEKELVLTPRRKAPA